MGSEGVQEKNGGRRGAKENGEKNRERRRLGLGGKKTGMERGMMIMEVRKTD